MRFFKTCSALLILVGALSVPAKEKVIDKITKDQDNFYVWHYGRKISSQDMSIPTEKAALAVENGEAVEKGKTFIKRGSFAGLVNRHYVKQRRIVYDKKNDRIAAKEWEDALVKKSTNVQMLALLIFYLPFFVLTIFKWLKLIGERAAEIGLKINYYAWAGIVVGALIVFLLNFVSPMESKDFIVAMFLLLGSSTGLSVGIATSLKAGKADKNKKATVLNIAFNVASPALPFLAGGAEGFKGFLIIWLAILAAALMQKSFFHKKEKTLKTA